MAASKEEVFHDEKKIQEYIKEIHLEVTDLLIKGFDPKQVEHYLARAKADPDDIMRMVIWFVIRGNSISKIINTLNAEGAAALRELKYKYNIRDNATIESDINGCSPITLYRVAMTYPILTCVVMNDFTKFRVSAVPSNYPKHMRTPAFASLIPRNDDSLDPASVQLLKKAQMLHQLELSKLTRKPGTTDEQLLRDVEQFCEAWRKDDRMDDSVKISFLLEEKLVENKEGGFQVSPAVKEAAEEFDKRSAAIRDN